MGTKIEGLNSNFTGQAVDRRQAEQQRSKLFADFRDGKAAPEQHAALQSEVQPVIDQVLSQIGQDAEDYRVRAGILAHSALKTYDPRAGASLKTHVYTALQGLNRFRSERTTAIKIPERQVYDRQKVNEYVKRHNDAHGIDPSDDMVAQELGISGQRVRRARGFSETPESFLQSEKGESGLSKSKSAERVWADYVHHDLDERNKQIFEWTTGYNGRPVLKKQDIAVRLGISPAAVSQRIDFIHARLSEGFGK